MRAIDGEDLKLLSLDAPYPAGNIVCLAVPGIRDRIFVLGKPRLAFRKLVEFAQVNPLVILATFAAKNRRQQIAEHVVGPAGAPVGDPGFGLTPAATLLAVAAANGVTVAVGQDATIVTRTGSTWQTIAPPDGVTASLLAVSINEAGNWVAVGENGTVVTSLGGTVSAAKLPSGVSNELLGVWLGDSNSACAVGSDGVVLTSPDGIGWTSHAAVAGVTGALHAVDFFDATHGWAVGDAATILQTADGGTTWTLAAAPAGVESTLRGVSALGTDAAAAVGDASTAIAIEGAGAWASLTLPPGISAGLTGVASAGGKLVACGERGTLLSAPLASGASRFGLAGVQLQSLRKTFRRTPEETFRKRPGPRLRPGEP